MQGRTGDLANYLVSKNIRPSLHRIKILDYIIRYSNHPTVDEIHKVVVNEVPTLSKTTVYNTLDLFVKAKILNGLYIDDNETRYDPILLNHGHFKCSRCGDIVDFAIDIDEFKSAGLEKFQILEKGVYFKGICPKCANR